MKRFLAKLSARPIVTTFAFASVVLTLVAAAATPSFHIADLWFNPYAVISAVTVVANLGLWIYYVSKPARTEERVWLSVYILGIFVYAFCELMMRLSANPHGALFWYNVMNMTQIGFPCIFLFALTYTERSERRFPGTIATLLLCAGFMVFILSFTNLIFVNDTRVATLKPWGYDFRNGEGPAVALILLWYYSFFVGAIVRLINFRRHTRNAILRKQSLIFILALSIPLVGGTITDTILPAFGVSSLPSLAGLLGTPAAILLIYGVVRYQLLTISPTLFSNTVLSIMQEAVVVTDSAFTIIFLNTQAESLLGVADRTNKISLLDHVTQRTLAKFQNAFIHTPAGGSTVTIDQIDIVRPHAPSLPVRITSTDLQLANYPTKVMVLTDISAELHSRQIIEHEVQVRTEELHRAQSYLVSSINSLEQGFILINHEVKVELVNKIAARMFAVTEDSSAAKRLTDVTGRFAWDINLPEVADRVMAAHKGRVVEALSREGSYYHVFVTPVLTGEHVLGAAIVIQDVTEQKILDRSKDEFFSIASHELRTPLTAIRGNMSMIHDYFPDALKDEGLASMVADTHDASVRLIGIVNDFLDSSKLEQGKMEFNLQPVAVAQIVESAAKDLKVIIDKQQDKLSVADLNKLPKVMADEGRVRQIVYNLLSNAAKYTQGGTIAISGEAKANKLLLRFTDTGKGISPENQKILFHKFQQAGDPLTRDDTKGTGLGLYISRLLAAHMHGEVELERSEEGKGSTFLLTLPVAKDEPASHQRS